MAYPRRKRKGEKVYVPEGGSDGSRDFMGNSAGIDRYSVAGEVFVKGSLLVCCSRENKIQNSRSTTSHSSSLSIPSVAYIIFI